MIHIRPLVIAFIVAAFLGSSLPVFAIRPAAAPVAPAAPNSPAAPSLTAIKLHRKPHKRRRKHRRHHRRTLHVTGIKPVTGPKAVQF